MAIYKRIYPDVNESRSGGTLATPPWVLISEHTVILHIGNADYWVRQTDKREAEYGDGNKIGEHRLGSIKLYRASREKCPINAAIKSVYLYHQKRIIDDLVAVSVITGKESLVKFETESKPTKKPKKK